MTKIQSTKPELNPGDQYVMVWRFGGKIWSETIRIEASGQEYSYDDDRDCYNPFFWSPCKEVKVLYYITEDGD